MNNFELKFRKEIARKLLSFGEIGPDSSMPLQSQELGLGLRQDIAFPEGLEPIPAQIEPSPSSDAQLPKADVVIITWTVAENEALADVLTPGFPRDTWHKYTRFFDQKYAPQIRKGAPALSSRRLGSYMLTKISDKTVLLFKSELHLNQDGIINYKGSNQTSLPVRELLGQLIQETSCSYIFSTGTCGAILQEHNLGDVLVTRASMFRCAQEFQSATFNHTKYTSEWSVPSTYFSVAKSLMATFADRLKEPIFGPPTKRHQGTEWKLDRYFTARIIHEAGDGEEKIPEFHPIVTTDYFEFGNSNNVAELWADGCGVEMGDAVLGLVCTEDLVDPPKWLVIRNISDPQINGDITSLPRSINMQVHWAVWYYEAYGYWTSIMSAITVWAVVAALGGE